MEFRRLRRSLRSRFRVGGADDVVIGGAVRETSIGVAGAGNAAGDRGIWAAGREAALYGVGLRGLGGAPCKRDFGLESCRGEPGRHFGNRVCDVEDLRRGERVVVDAKSSSLPLKSGSALNCESPREFLDGRKSSGLIVMLVFVATGTPSTYSVPVSPLSVTATWTQRPVGSVVEKLSWLRGAAVDDGKLHDRSRAGREHEIMAGVVAKIEDALPGGAAVPIHESGNGNIPIAGYIGGQSDVAVGAIERDGLSLTPLA